MLRNVSTTLQPRRARHGSELPELTGRGLPTGIPSGENPSASKARIPQNAYVEQFSLDVQLHSAAARSARVVKPNQLETLEFTIPTLLVGPLCSAACSMRASQNLFFAPWH